MTCIAAVVQDGVVYLAGERGASEGDFILPLEKPKVWKDGEYLLGYYGTMYGELVQNYFEPPKYNGSNPDKHMKTTFRKALKEFYSEWDVEDDSKEFGMIIGFRGKIYESNIIDMSMTSFTIPFISSGSGGSYAMGSLYSTQSYKDPKRRLKIALECAIEYSTSCLGPIDIISSEG